MLEGFSYWLQPEYLFAINIFFPRSSCSPTIPSHKKLMQQLWRSLPPSTVWDFFNPANAQKVATHHPVPKFQYWDAVPRQEYCKILVDHVKAALETRTTFAGVLCSSSLGTGAGTIQFLDRPFPGSDTHLLQTIKLFAQFLPISSDVELHLQCVLTTINSLWRGWGVLFNLLCEKCHELEDKGLEHVSEI